MNAARFQNLTSNYTRLRLAVVGDLCLDRYLEIDPGKQEISIETQLPVHNVVRVRSQPGAAGTILNNLVALGVAEIYPVGFCGDDGEGYELQRALRTKPGVHLDHFLQTQERRTFTYCKPLVIEAGKAPKELNRLDSKNWTPTPPTVQAHLVESLREIITRVDAIILMDQVDIAETGVVTSQVLDTVRHVAAMHPRVHIIADSRRSLRGFPPVIFKMNAAELAALVGSDPGAALPLIQKTALDLARRQRQPVIVTLAERGIIGAAPPDEVHHVSSLPPRGEIDIVGAGDAVTANLAAALAAGATLPEALELAMLAASVVIHQLGTTGTATVAQIDELLPALG